MEPIVQPRKTPLLDRIYELRDEIYDGGHTRLSAAYQLRVEGYSVTVDRAFDLLGRDMREVEANHPAIFWAAKQEFEIVVARQTERSAAPAVAR